MEIVDEIVDKLCLKCGLEIENDLAGLVVKHIALQHSYKDLSLKAISPEEIEKLIEESAELIRDSSSPKFNIIKIQHQFDKLFKCHEKNKLDLQVKCLIPSLVLSAHQIDLKKQIIKIISEYCEIFSIQSEKFRTIIILKEIESCLDSILTAQELANFSSQESKQQKNQLEEVCNIASGIRFYNQLANKGGVGLRNIFQELETQEPKCSTTIISLEETYNVLNEAISVASRIGYEYSRIVSKDSEKNKHFVMIKDCIAMGNLYLKILKSIDLDLKTCIRNSQEMLTAARKEFHHLDRIFVGNILAVREDVLPRFDLIGRIALDALKTLNLSTHSAEKYEEMLKFKDSVKYFLESTQKYEIEPLHLKKPKLEIGRSIEEEKQSEYALNGFCIVTLVTTDGLLLRGEEQFTTQSSTSEKKFVFESKIKQKLFAEDQDYFTEKLNEITSKTPEIEAIISSQSFSSDKYLMDDLEKTKISVCIGTEDCYYESKYNLDSLQEFNSSAVRKIRELYRISNLIRSKSRTISVQTEQQMNKRQIDTQIYLPKTVETQTRILKNV